MANFPYIPLGQWIFVTSKRPKEKEVEKTKSGIYIPDTVSDTDHKKKKISEVGIVRAISPKVDIGPFDVGDEIVFSNMGITRVEIDGKEITVVPPENVLCVKKDVTA